MSPWWPMKSDWSSRTITHNFGNRTRLSVDARRNDAQVKQTVGFEFELAFFKWQVGESIAMPLSFAEKDWKRDCCSYTVHERYVFEFESLYGIQKGLWMFFSYHASLPLLSLGTRDTIFNPCFLSTLITNFVQSTVFRLTRRPVGLARFQAARILKTLDR